MCDSGDDKSIYLNWEIEIVCGNAHNMVDEQAWSAYFSTDGRGK